ncbi:copper-binding protein [Paraburkholderia sp. ZP32-5]|uniref:copper-binding protein n=1 Tax=Paraburkholderia sp. ZP32-5 TaxID=2883245 RepID=UPI001F47DE02|nr:copper-binding protein [Paraburkholderia sp. ZP32-5]
MKTATIGAALMIAAMTATQPARAQDDMASTAQAVLGAVQPVHMKAEIVGIDPGNRSLTLKGEHGNVAVVLVSQQVAGFDQLKVGDRVDVLYKNALLTKAEKVSGKGIRERIDKQSYTPASGGYESARQTEVLATVLKIDRKQRLVTLRGAYQTQTFQAAPDIDLSDVKVGDTVHAVFVSAAAVQVTPAGQ